LERANQLERRCFNIKLIIAGSRRIFNYFLISTSAEKYFPEAIEIISGTAKGVDKLGERYAKSNKLKLTPFPADWDSYGKSAGYRRNVEMANYADACLVIWDGHSSGSKHMIDIANKQKLKVVYYNMSTQKYYKNF